MKLHNTLTRKIETFKPLDGSTARVYSCGPTVYNHAHIGNLGSYVYFDILRRTLAITGLQVDYVMNYTDVDDKTIRRSRELFPDDDPAAALKKLGDKYIAIFNDEMRRIGNDISSTTFVRATDPTVIQGMKDLITKLHAAGFAYLADDGVYFSIDAYKKAGKTYGQLSEISAASTSAARIQNDEYDKESAHDFALWKVQKEDEPAWDFTLDGRDVKGRPGWHIECSVMSRQKLGQPFDIHTGGVDLVFPHHENEIAQSTALEGEPLMARFFVHNEHVLVDGKKMSKSLGNFYTLEDILQKGYDPLAFRLKVLQSHYRSQVNFTWESLDAAQNLLQNLRAWADLKHQKAAQDNSDAEAYKPQLKAILDAVQDDLNTPAALTKVAELADQKTIHPEKIQPLLNTLDKLFGLQLADRPDITKEQKNLLAEREAGRQTKDWAKSDEVRGQLAKQGIGVRDTAKGPIWFRQ
jgi:cysteinyl-tRNA synthetase